MGKLFKSKMKSLYGRIIKKICKIHSIQYCKEPEANLNPVWENGFCDICEVTGAPNVPQSITKPSFFRGLRIELFEEMQVPNP